MTELLRDKIELQEKATKWKSRARALQRERVGFVERWRQQNRAAGEAGLRLAAVGSALHTQTSGGALVGLEPEADDDEPPSSPEAAGAAAIEAALGAADGDDGDAGGWDDREPGHGAAPPRAAARRAADDSDDELPGRAVYEY